MRQLACKLSSKIGGFRKQQFDFFGIASITNKDIEGRIAKNGVRSEDIKNKYSLLRMPRSACENEESIQTEQYGHVRRDEDNLIDFHGKFEAENQNQLIIEKVNVRDYYETSVDGFPHEANTIDEEQIHSSEFKLIEVKPHVELKEALDAFKTGLRQSPLSYNSSPLTFDFTFSIEESLSKLKPNKYKRAKIVSKEFRELLETQKEKDGLISDDDSYKNQIDHEICKTVKPIEGKDSFDDTVENEYEKNFDFDKQLDIDYKQRMKVEEPVSASSYLQFLTLGKVKAESSLNEILASSDSYPMKCDVRLDSKGFNDYKTQVIDWKKCMRSEIIDYLKQSIVYNNYDVLAINKPYGLCSHVDTSDTMNLNVESLMQELAPSLRIQRLYLAHRLDKTTSGILLFATSKERATHLNKLFLSGQVTKKYWCITRGLPNPAKAIIDIPIGENRVDGKVRRCLVPEIIESFKQLTPKFTETKRAVTEYRILSSGCGMSLVEVSPRTGVKHQIRCHLGFGLSTPILGDHKYTYLDKIVPQKLNPQALKALHVRQEKVRTLPIHLHSKTVVLPEIKPNKQSLFITASIPKHFQENMKSLGLINGSIKSFI